MCKPCYDQQWAKDNKERLAAYRQQWYATNKTRSNATTRRNHLRTKYNMTESDYQQMLVQQNGVCAICRQQLSEVRPVIDHCHATKKVRGILCDRCNTGIGKFKDDPVIIQKAIAYLEAHSG